MSKRLLGLIFIQWLLLTSAAKGQVQLWFAPESHFPPAVGSDFLDLFKVEYTRLYDIRRIDVFQLSTQFFLKAPDDVVEDAIKYLNKYGIALAVTAEIYCGARPTSTAQAQLVARRIRNAGGTIRYIAMDEPFWNVHAAPVPGTPLEKACSLSVNDSAMLISKTIKEYTSLYPDLKVGDVEPFPVLFSTPNWAEEYLEFLDSVQRQIDKRIAFVQLDFDWRERRILSGSDDEVIDVVKFEKIIVDLVKFIHAHKRDAGVIVNGKANARSDLEWVQQATEHLQLIERSGVRLEQMAIESWHRHPLKNLPESNAASLTSLFNQLER